jgi:latrophilin 1
VAKRNSGKLLSRPFPASESAFARIFGRLDDRVQLTGRSNDVDTRGGGNTKAVYFAYKSLHEILARAEQNVNVPGRSRSRGRHGLILNSHVISASLAKGRHVQLKESERVRVTLKHLKTHNVSDPVCVFWDFEQSAWSDEGCVVVDGDENSTVCECDHLTNFALLMAERNGADGVELESAGTDVVFVLQIFSYIAIALALLCIVIIVYKVSVCV